MPITETQEILKIVRSLDHRMGRVEGRLDSIAGKVDMLSTDVKDVLDIAIFIKDNAVTRDEFERETKGDLILRRVKAKQK